MEWNQFVPEFPNDGVTFGKYSRKVKMTADLPSVVTLSRAGHASGLRQQTWSRPIAKSAIAAYQKNYDSTGVFPEITYNQAQRKSEGQVLQVTFAPEVETFKQNRTTGCNSAVNVSHDHYEQWARVPGKQITKHTLLRGIQVLNARMKREGIDMERNEPVLKHGGTEKDRNGVWTHSRDLHINQLKRNTLLTRDKLSEDNYMTFRRERSNIVLENVGVKNMLPPKSPLPLRNPLKTNAHVIDSGVFKQVNKWVNETAEAEVKASRNTERDSARLRHGVSRIRDRSALPVSVYQPINIGDHVFLMNEPIKYTEFEKIKKTEYIIKKDPKSSVMLVVPKKQKELSHLAEELELQEAVPIRKADDITESFQRSRTFAGTLLPARTKKRSQVSVSSAELCDFSQLSDIRHSMTDTLFERNQAELVLPNRTTRWIQNV